MTKKKTRRGGSGGQGGKMIKDACYLNNTTNRFAYQTALYAIMEQNQVLTSFGLGVHHTFKDTQERQQAAYTQSRLQLFNSVDEFIFCVAWLRCQPRKRVLGYSSYGLKHLVEADLRNELPLSNAYVSNGAFIAALEYLGIPYKEQGPNVIVQGYPRGQQ